MAEMTIRLRIDPETGKKDIIIGLHSDEDALPQEHEALHRKLVDRLVEGGTLKADQVGRVIVEREERKGEAVQTPVGEVAPERRSVSEPS